MTTPRHLPPLDQLGRQPASRRRRRPDPGHCRRGRRPRQGGVGHRTPDQGGRQRPLLHRHRGRRRPAAAACTGWPTWSRSTATLVTVQAGMPLSPLNALLAEHGLAMPNLGDIDAQTVAGAISTGTHGTGAAHSTLASCVEAVTLVTGTGEVAARRTTDDRDLPGRAARPRRARRPGRGDAALRGRRSRCWPTSGRCRWPRCWPASTTGSPATTTSSSTGTRTPTGRSSSATTGCRPTTGRCRGSAAGWTTSSCPTPSSRAPAGSAGRSRRRSRRSARSPPGP